METKPLSNCDLSITLVGFGAWAIGGSGLEFGWGAQDDKASVAAIHRALERGINWIDTVRKFSPTSPHHCQRMLATKPYGAF
jgi:aryl-alcohol dehydrogenase-like predicted oxidoreductase